MYLKISMGGNFNYTGLGANAGSTQQKKDAYSRYLGGALMFL